LKVHLVEEEMKGLAKKHQEMYALTIQPEEIIYLVQEMSKLHNEGVKTDWYSSVGILAERHKGDRSRAVCISQRMMCLAKVMEDDRMRAWTKKPEGKEYILTNQAAFIAAAKCPLRYENEELFFDPEEFFQIALAESPAEGEA